MSCRTSYFAAFTALVLLALPISSPHAEGTTKHVFELFTSQGCYSCPPAEELLGRIVDQNDEILALEFHVDYWDTLVYGSAGQWKDPFSSPLYSKRQRDYNLLPLDGRTGVYTPQMIVDGSYSFVGSRSRQAQKQMNKDSNFVLDTFAAVANDGSLTIRVDGKYGEAADVWLVSYDEKHITKVESGENMGKTLKSQNIVRDLQSLGKWQGESLVIETNIEPLKENQNCAVIIQTYSEVRDRILGPIVGAAKCKPA